MSLTRQAVSIKPKSEYAVPKIYVFLFCSLDMKQARKTTRPTIVKGMGKMVVLLRVVTSVELVLLERRH